MPAFELCAFWDSRPGTVEGSAEEIMQLLRALGASDPRLARWLAAGEPARSIDGVDDVRDALLRHPETWEHGDVPYHAHAVRLENVSVEGGRVKIDVLAQVDRPSGSVWFPNRLIIGFWGPGSRNAFTDMSLVVRLIDVVVALFQPAWVAVGPEGLLRREWEDLMDGKPIVSWMLYLSPEYGPVGPVPAPARVSRLRNGALITTVPEWFDPNDADHEDARASALAALEAQGKRPLRVVLAAD